MNEKKTNIHSYIILLKVDNMEVGGVYDHELHCSLVLWFKTSANRDELTNVCDGVLASREPIVLKAMGKEDFGSKSPLLVRLIEKTKELAKAHSDILDKLEKLPNFSLLEPQYSRDGWRPHVTFQKMRSLKEKEEFTTSSVYLLEASGDLEKDAKHVFAEVKFGHKKEA